MSSTKFKDHFSANAGVYRKFRPGYPPELFTWLAGLAPERKAAWDCATGNGQAARLLNPYFDLVAASDGSIAQLDAAGKEPGISFLAAYAEAPPFRPFSLDLITVAAALHWFDIPLFFSKVKSVLKPGGVIAVWSYDLVNVNSEVDRIVNRFYHEILAGFWPEERKLVEDGYRQVEFPFRELEVPGFEMSAHWSGEQLLGYLSTWSAAKNYAAAAKSDALDLIRDELHEAWGDPEIKLEISWPLNIRVGINEV